MVPLGPWDPGVPVGVRLVPPPTVPEDFPLHIGGPKAQAGIDIFFEIRCHDLIGSGSGRVL